MKIKFLSLIAILIISGCASDNDRTKISHNFLIIGMKSKDIVTEWGYPSQTVTKDGGANDFQVEWGAVGGFGGFSFTKGRAYDVWYYAGRGATVVSYRGRLVAWKWNTDGAVIKPYTTK